MTIEETLSRLAINIGRIAEALEVIAKSQGIVLDEQGQLDLEPEEKPAAASKKADKKKGSKKKGKKKNEVVVGKTDDSDEVWTLPLIRAELHKLQEQENQAAVKSILKQHGASTLGQVDQSKYARLAADIAKKLDE